MPGAQAISFAFLARRAFAALGPVAALAAIRPVALVAIMFVHSCLRFGLPLVLMGSRLGDSFFRRFATCIGNGRLIAEARHRLA